MPYASSSKAATNAPHRKNAALRSQYESRYQQRTTQKDSKRGKVPSGCRVVDRLMMSA